MNKRIAIVFIVVALAAAALGVYFGAGQSQSTLPFGRAAKPKPPVVRKT